MSILAIATRHKLTGICPPARGAFVSELRRTQPGPVWLVVTEDIQAAEQLGEDIGFFSQGAGSASLPDVLIFPESIPDSRDMREAFAASSDRLNVLTRLRGVRGTKEAGASIVIVTTPAALLQPVPAPEKLAEKEIKLTRGQKQSFSGLLEQLRTLDYDSEALCEAPAQYAIRGGIIDVYPVTASEPYRLDFFGDEIEAIRIFDPVTQRSGGEVEEIVLATSPRVRLDPARAGISDYLPGTARLVLIEPAALGEEFEAFASDDAGGLAPLLERCAVVFGLFELDEASPIFQGAPESNWDTSVLAHFRRYPADALVAQERLGFEIEARRDFLREVGGWSREGYDLVFVAAKEGEEQRMREILAEEASLKPRKLRFFRGALNEGFKVTYGAVEPALPLGQAVGLAPGQRPGLQNRGPSSPALPSILSPSGSARGLVVVTETEIFGRKRLRRGPIVARAAAQRAQVDQLLDFSELVEGDYVVHIQHGIAHFRGLKRLETAQGTKEVISIEFDGGVTLHVPLTESHLVSRYVGLSKAKPQLGRIGSGRWEKIRRAAERSTLDLAAELLQIQASREAQPGYGFSPDSPWQKEFEASFPFVATPDQVRAIAETKADMERPRPMDRLICGDVGFGKTEVAIRAAFKSAQDGRQAAVLVPTTILAQQHLNTFRERMAGYPVAIEMLSRFRSPSEQKQLLAATAAGQVDILIGTHRMLQKDVKFKELGLVIIDEEQRFGVKHKEVFKHMRETVDVLSMSATPIPRTLYLALTGARDLSVIETAPTNRHPIQTIVKTYEEKTVVDAVRHEIRRGGQVFYLHNRVATIDLVAARLRSLLPDLVIGVGHGQMPASKLEQVMTEFVAGKFQVLVCTTIIESGLDIPNCNTLIIEGADRFGLAQLYQLRGRVGRFKHQAYAYLLLHRHTRLLDIARQRLGAIRQHNQLGAGFRIAMRDLELRGAGNLLGPEQSGHIVGVGFELYCQLLRQSVARLKGDKSAAAIRATVKIDFVFVGEGASDEPGPGRRQDGYTALKEAEDEAVGDTVASVQARIPPDYIGESRLRIDFYRRLALAGQVAALRRIEEELRDRFGKFGDEVRTLLFITEIRIRAEHKGLLSVETESNRLKCLRNSGRHDDWVMNGSRFPRLTAARPLLRLQEIISFLAHLPNP